MDKKTFTGLFLMLIAIVGSVFLMRPSEEEIQNERALQVAIAQARNISIDTPASSSLDTGATSAYAQEVDSIALSGPCGRAKAGQQEIGTRENELIKVNISKRVGKVEAGDLKGQKAYG